HLDRTTAAIDPGLAKRRLHAAEREAVALHHDTHGLRVVDELDALLDGSVQLVLAGWYLGRTAPVEDLYVLAARQSFGHATCIHGDIAAADYQDRFRQGRSLAVVHPAQKADSVDHLRMIVAGNAHRLSPPGADGQQHRIMAPLQLVE